MKFFNIYIPTFVFAALNLLVLFLILRHFLFKPVTKLMSDRTNSIRESLENAERQKTDAAELKQKYEVQLRSAREEGEKIITEARAKADREQASILAAARQESEAILERARQEIEHERQQMLKEVKGQVAGIALAAASKVLEANMDTEANKALVDKFIDEAGAA
jgi:F-type H+-transporting ATPase subunit b